MTPQIICPSESCPCGRGERPSMSRRIVQDLHGTAPSYEIKSIRRKAERPEGEIMPVNHKYGGWSEGRAFTRRCGKACPRTGEWQVPSVGRSLFLLGKIPTPWVLSALIATGSRPSVPICRSRGSTPRGTAVIAMGQSHSDSQPGGFLSPGQFGYWESSIGSDTEPGDR